MDDVGLRPRTPNGVHSRTNSRTHNRMPSIQRVEYDEKELQMVIEPLLEEQDRYILPARRRINLALALPWALSFVLACVCIFLLAKEPAPHPLGSFAKGFSTELFPARSAISIRNQPFYGSLDFKNHHGFVPEGSPSLAYIGSTPDVDAAWDALSKDRYFLLSDSEARAAYGPGPLDEYWNEHHGGYVAGLDVLHTLHCLDHLRRSLYPRTYPQDPVDGTMHNAHCVDHLRQLAMCHADLTPVPTRWFDGLQRNYINSSREHTCRDFGTVRDWATERFNGSTAVKPRNRDGSPRENFFAPWYRRSAATE